MFEIVTMNINNIWVEIVIICENNIFFFVYYIFKVILILINFCYVFVINCEII